jgi:hypothetical protein
MKTIALFIRYFWEVVFHKLCILLAGIRVNKTLSSTPYQVPYTRLILHDLSKFSRSEFWPYAEHFLGNKKKPEEFHQAWLHHVHYNDHHWEHFVENYASVAKNITNNDPLDNLIIHEMPDEAILEMLSDNLAASRSYEGYWPNGTSKDGWKWMTNAYNRHKLHPITRIKFGAFICALGYEKILPQKFDWTTIEKANISNEEKRKLLKLQELAQSTN